MQLGLEPIHEVESFFGGTFQRDEDGGNTVYTCTFDQPATVNFALTAAEGSMVALLAAMRF